MPTNWTTWTKWINSQKHSLPKLNQEEPENLNRQITLNEIETVIKKLPKNKTQSERKEGNNKYQSRNK